jgi:hypothetical protein
METLKISKQKALQLYPKASVEFKELMEETFGKDFFSKKITDRVKTFEDACEIIGEDPNDKKYTMGEVDVIAYQKLKVIAKVLNEGWSPDWNNSNQYKWFPWFYMNNPGFRFSAAYCDYTGTHSAGGSRLCFQSEELAKYAGNQFLELYNQLMN